MNIGLINVAQMISDGYDRLETVFRKPSYTSGSFEIAPNDVVKSIEKNSNNEPLKNFTSVVDTLERISASNKKCAMMVDDILISAQERRAHVVEDIADINQQLTALSQNLQNITAKFTL